MLGMCALITSTSTMPLAPISENSNVIDKVTPSSRVEKASYRKNRSLSTAPALYSYMSNLFGYNAKTMRSLSEEAECGNEVSVNSWIREGYDPDELDAYGYTPLLNAAALGRLNAVVELIKNGADLNKQGPFGFTPLQAAAQNGHREVVSELLKHGAEINAQNDDKDTAMHLALRSFHIEIVYMLLRNGANTRIEGFKRKDCVSLASEYGLNDLARTLKNFNPTIGHHAHSAPNMKRKSVQSK